MNTNLYAYHGINEKLNQEHAYHLLRAYRREILLHATPHWLNILKEDVLNQLASVDEEVYVYLYSLYQSCQSVRAVREQ